MSAWTQIGGDMTWERHGVVLANVHPRLEQVELVKIEPWIEHGKSAAIEQGGLYLVDRKTLDFSDLALDNPTVADALRYSGLSAAEYEELEPEHRAELVAAATGYDESATVDSLAAALPAPVEGIVFWGGHESRSKIDEYDRDLRREVLEANFKTRMSFGVLPSRDAVEFAMGGEPFTMEPRGEDELAFSYAVELAGLTGAMDDADELLAVVHALAEAPSPRELPEDADDAVRQLVERWEQRYGDPDDEDTGITNAARSLASSIMESLGFEWI